jgi:hypothetical protein
LTSFDDNLALALELSHRIIALGKEGKWDQVPDLDEQRLRLLKALFTDDTMASRGEAFKAQIETLLRLNEEAVAICARARSDSMASSRAAKHGMHAINAYHKQSNSR